MPQQFLLISLTDSFLSLPIFIYYLSKNVKKKKKKKVYGYKSLREEQNLADWARDRVHDFLEHLKFHENSKY